MFFKTLLYIALFMNCLCADAQQLNITINKIKKLIDKKKATKQPFELSLMFDEIADDTKKLVENLDKDCSTDQQKNNQRNTIKMIADNMAAMKKLLTLMALPEPLQDYCGTPNGDSCQTIICNRPVKKVTQPNKRKRDYEAYDEAYEVKRRKLSKQQSEHDDELVEGSK